MLKQNKADLIDIADRLEAVLPHALDAPAKLARRRANDEEASSAIERIGAAVSSLEASVPAPTPPTGTTTPTPSPTPTAPFTPPDAQGEGDRVREGD